MIGQGRPSAGVRCLAFAAAPILRALADSRKLHERPSIPGGRKRTPNRIALLLEAIALHHQIAVLERSGTRRPCVRLWDRFFWILFSRWWPEWRDSLIIVQPETVLRWRREG